MQTFLPFPDFHMSAQCLDRARLGKQRVEVKQLLLSLGVTVGANEPIGSSWANHPASKMWRGYEWALAQYGASICAEWIRRGYRDSLQVEFAKVYTTIKNTGLPPWIGWDAFHISHASNLVRKDPEYYGPIFPGVPNNLPYIWPSPELYAGLAMGFTSGVKTRHINH